MVRWPNPHKFNPDSSQFDPHLPSRLRYERDTDLIELRPEQNPLLIDGEIAKLTDLYEIEEQEEHHNDRFRTKQIDSTVRIDARVESSSNPEVLFDLIIKDLIESTSVPTFTNPHVSLSLNQNNTTNSFHIHFMKLENVSPSMIRRELEHSAQSKAMPSPLLQSELSIRISHVDMPQGSGKRYGESDDSGDYCLPSAIAVGIAFVNRRTAGDHWRSISRSGKKQTIEALRLQQRTVVKKSKNYEIEEVRIFQKLLSEENIQLIVFDGTRTRAPLFIGPYYGDDRTLGLRLSDGHFDHIKKISAFFGSHYYCAYCNVLYNNERDHYNCRLKCQRCGARHSDGCVGEEQINCDNCDGLFLTQKCYDNHARTGVRGGKPYCKSVARCDKCAMRLIENRTGRFHKCGHSYCKRCQTDAPIGHETCFISPIGPLSDDFVKKTIVFDIETTVEEVNYVKKKNKVKKFRHKPNLIMALRSCEHCETRLPSSPEDFDLECLECGGQKLHSWSCFDDPDRDILKEFVDWLFSPQHKKFTVIAHNLRSFDGQFILRQVGKSAPLHEEDFCLVGMKLMFLRGNDVRFVDSLNFLTMPLADFSSTFDIKELKKGHYPHQFNLPVNYSYVGRTPPLDNYISKNTKPKLKEEISKWHASVANEAGRIFRVLLRKDLYQVFRRKFLKANTLAIEKREAVKENQSRMALKYLSWLRYSTGENIRDYRNGGEFKIPGTNFKVDGYVEVKGGRSKVYEIYGDYYHACECRYDDHHTILGLTGYEIRARDKKRLDLIRKDYDVVVVRECEIRQMLKENAEMAAYYKELDLQDPLETSEGFSGGRTEVYKTFHECSDDEEIVYLDFCSLYPTVNKYEPYPVGLGDTIAGDRIQVPISRSQDLAVDGVKVEGFVKCKIAPPRNLDLPVLMMRAGGKNCYAACRTCALAQNPFGKRCNHSEQEREMAGVWTTFELRLALEEGYVITRVYQVRHYDEWRQYKHSVDGIVQHGIMSEYMNFFVKKKTEASGWPRPNMTTEEKKKFIGDYEKKEGIRLDENKIVRKPAGRAVSKLMANSLWGKLGEKSNRRSNKIFHSPHEYFSFLKDGSNTICDIVVLTDHKILVVYKKVDEEVESIDTDSIIFVKKKSEKNPLEDLMGDFLGDLTSEIPSGAHCTQFVALAPKTYAYRLQFDDGSVKEVVKCKGFPLTCEASEKIKFDAMVGMVSKMVRGEEVEPLNINYELFSITKEHHVETTSIVKKFGVSFTKRCFVAGSYDTVPYGY